MPELKYNNVGDYIEKTTAEHFPAFVLIHGEEFLYKAVLDKMIGHLLPGTAREFSYFPHDGDNNQISVALSKVNTYSFMPEKKVVAILDSRIFYAKLNANSILEKAKDAFEKNELKKAAKFFVNFLANKGLCLEDLGGDDRFSRMGVDHDESSRWVSELLNHCRDKKMALPEIKDHTELIREVLEKGVPSGHHLIITTDLADKRRKLYRLLKENGLIVDCTVPKGDRRADKVAQEAVLREKMTEVMSGTGKTVEGRAFQAICECTGFELRTFTHNLEKLIQYVGERKRIKESDVAMLLKRTKEDPIYEFTNAVADRNLESALFYMGSLLAQEMYPLQILSAITNQVRKLLLAFDFAARQGDAWASRLSYDRFKRDEIKAMQAYEKTILEKIESWETSISGSRDPKGRKKKPKNGFKNSIVLVKNLNNPFPVYQLILKSQKFTRLKLIQIIEKLNVADLNLKTSAQNPKLVLEDVLLFICR